MKIELTYDSTISRGWHLKVIFNTFQETSVTSWYCVKPTKRQIRKNKKFAKTLIG